MVMQSTTQILQPFFTSVSPLQRKMIERRMAALKQDSSESESEDGATTYRSLAGMTGHETLPLYSAVQH